jgi:hypothetical protein
MKTIGKALAVALALGAASAAHAGTTSVNFESNADTSVRKLGSFSGTATYDDAAGLLTITINNTSAASHAALTALAFNITGNAKAVYHDGDVAGTKADEDIFDDARPHHGKGLIKAKPLGNFEAGAGINGKFNPPGRKLANAAGVAAGGSHTFTFDVTGGGGLTAADFITGNSGLAAAFRGKKIDKVGSVIVQGSIVSPGAGGNTGNEGGITPPIIFPGIDPPIILPPITAGGDGGNNNPGGAAGQPAAVPLPPAAIPAIATFAVMALPKLKRKLRELV